MNDTLVEHFHATEPRLQMNHIEENNITFQLQDCDGFPQGKMVAHKVNAICMSTTGVGYENIRFFKKAELEARFPWLVDQADDDVVMAQLTPSWDMDEAAIPLPSWDGKRLAYILASSFSYIPENGEGLEPD